MNCPECDSGRTIKNGSRKNGKQNYICLSCSRQFVEDPSPHYHISEETKTLIDRLLLEKLPLAGIARVTQVSERWLQNYVNAKYEAIPQKLKAVVKKKSSHSRV